MDVWEGGASAAPAAGPSREDLISQVQYVDKLFEWAFSNEVFEAMSAGGKAQVRELYHNFAAARSAGPEAPGLPQVLMDSLSGLESVVAAEGLPAMSASGYGSASDYDSPVSEGEGKGGVSAAGRRIAKSHYPAPGAPTVEPWRLVALIQLIMCFLFVFLILCTVVDIVLGDCALLTAPHWSRPPMTRPAQLPSGMATPIGGGFSHDSVPHFPEEMAWTEEHRKPGTVIVGPNIRRLSSSVAGVKAASWNPQELRSALQGLMDALPSRENQASKSERSVTVKAPVTFPTFFEPKLLACGPEGRVAALTPRGFGAVATLQGSVENAKELKLTGLSQLPPLVGATWGQDGILTVATRLGHLLACVAGSEDGVRSCEPLPSARLPLLEGARLTAAATAWIADGSTLRLHAAIVEESSPGLVAIYVLEEHSWLPLGELQLEGKAGRAGKLPVYSISFQNGELLIATEAGDLRRHRIEDGAVTRSSHDVVGNIEENAQTAWQAACSLQPDGGVAHLRLHRGAGGHAWRPEVLTTPRASTEAVLIL